MVEELRKLQKIFDSTSLCLFQLYKISVNGRTTDRQVAEPHGPPSVKMITESLWVPLRTGIIVKTLDITVVLALSPNQLERSDNIFLYPSNWRNCRYPTTEFMANAMAIASAGSKLTTYQLYVPRRCRCYSALLSIKATVYLCLTGACVEYSLVYRASWAHPLVYIGAIASSTLPSSECEFTPCFHNKHNLSALRSLPSLDVSRLPK